MTSPEVAGSWRLTSVAVSPAGDRLEVPHGWVVQTGPPTVVTPSTWVGEPPAIVVSAERDELRGPALAAAVARAAADRLVDPVIVGLDLVGDVGQGPGVEIVVAHRHRGVDVTTVERHHRRGDLRWVVAFTAAHADAPALLPLAQRVVASLTIGP